MTDLEKFAALYKSFGIELEIEDGSLGGLKIKMSEGDNPKFDGHPGFYSLVWFDSEGKFYGQGFWE